MIFRTFNATGVVGAGPIAANAATRPERGRRLAHSNVPQTDSWAGRSSQMGQAAVRPGTMFEGAPMHGRELVRIIYLDGAT